MYRKEPPRISPEQSRFVADRNKNETKITLTRKPRKPFDGSISARIDLIISIRCCDCSEYLQFWLLRISNKISHFAWLWFWSLKRGKGIHCRRKSIISGAKMYWPIDLLLLFELWSLTRRANVRCASQYITQVSAATRILHSHPIKNFSKAKICIRNWWRCRCAVSSLLLPPSCREKCASGRMEKRRFLLNNCESINYTWVSEWVSEWCVLVRRINWDVS